MISSSTVESFHNMDSRMSLKTVLPSSSRILDIPCKVCGDFSSGKHYNIFACDGCAGFFKRSIRRNRQYVCKAKDEGRCVVDKTHRNQCRACRLAKCQEAGMNKDAVQHERGPRNSTLRRQQMAHFYAGETRIGPVLDLAIPKPGPTSPLLEPPMPLMPPPGAFICNPAANIPRMPFGIPLPPPIITQMVSPSAVCESAARLLFMNVKWAKNVPSFTALPLPDQLLMLEESWRELFVLGSAQFLTPMELNSLVHSTGILERDPEKSAAFLKEVKEFQETSIKIAQFQMDPHELACLRAIVLFKTNFEKPTTSSSSASSNEDGALSDATAVGAIQEHTQLTLNKYIATAYPGQPLRFGKLLLLLPVLRTVSGRTIEELFFRKTIGSIPIERIIIDMYKTTTSDML